jgi:hypothetical protein
MSDGQRTHLDRISTTPGEIESTETDVLRHGHPDVSRGSKMTASTTGPTSGEDATAPLRPWTLLASCAVSRFLADLDDPPATADRVMALRILRDEVDIALEREALAAHRSGESARLLAVALRIPARQARERYRDADRARVPAPERAVDA